MVTTQTVCGNVAADCFSTGLAQLIADGERWQAYARRMNDKVIQSGLVTEEEVAQGRKAAEAALTRPVVGSRS